MTVPAVDDRIVPPVTEIGATTLPSPPASGRVLAAARRVRLGDVSPRGRARLDALARYLQDVARDDSADAQFPDPMAWVVRRTLIEVTTAPRFQEMLELATWCSGFGGRWAERRTRIAGDGGGAVDAASTWVHIDWRTAAPRRLPEEFHEVWGRAAAGRRVSARLILPTEPGADASQITWSMRACDLDVMGHMNNAAHWAAVVEAADRLGVALSTFRAELEHIAPVEPHGDLRLWAQRAGEGADIWLTVDGVTASAARVRPLATASAARVRPLESSASS